MPPVDGIHPPPALAERGNTERRHSLDQDSHVIFDEECEATMSRPVLVPSPAHRITVVPTQSRVVVKVDGTVVADTTSALTLQEADYPPVQYIPMADVDQSLLRRTDTSTYCPFKGDASYYTIGTPDRELADVVWSYETPYPAVDVIAGHVAFYPQHVELTVGGDR
jgi:uncharacterized protein (DUF427 family)